MLAQVFGPHQLWPAQDLIGFTHEFNRALVLGAYHSGVFPMPLHEAPGFGDVMGWWSPMRRGVIDPTRLRISRSLRKSAAHYHTSVDVAFEAVLDACADPGRPGGWIDADIKAVFTQLYDDGLVHSVETWDGSGRLVGGLYGVSVGGLFAGESMFHDDQFGRDASKVALMRLAEELISLGVGLLDVQWATDHLRSLGAVEISRQEYLRRLAVVLDEPTPMWVSGLASRR